MDSAVDSIAGGVHPGVTIIFETTLPVGDTRAGSATAGGGNGPQGGERLLRRLLAGAALSIRVRSSPTLGLSKLVGGIGPESGRRAANFYDSVLDAEIVAMSCAEAAEFSKIADTTIATVNIALAHDFAMYADRVWRRHPGSHRRRQ